MAGSRAVVAGAAGASDLVWTGAAAGAAEDSRGFSADDWALTAAETNRMSMQTGITGSTDAARPRRNAKSALMGLGNETPA